MQTWRGSDAWRESGPCVADNRPIPDPRNTSEMVCKVVMVAAAAITNTMADAERDRCSRRCNS
jgi:hypothetical protein